MNPLLQTLSRMNDRSLAYDQMDAQRRAADQTQGTALMGQGIQARGQNLDQDMGAQKIQSERDMLAQKLGQDSSEGAANRGLTREQIAANLQSTGMRESGDFERAAQQIKQQQAQLAQNAVLEREKMAQEKDIAEARNAAGIREAGINAGPRMAAAKNPLDEAAGLRVKLAESDKGGYDKVSKERKKRVTEDAETAIRQMEIRGGAKLSNAERAAVYGKVQQYHDAQQAEQPSPSSVPLNPG